MINTRALIVVIGIFLLFTILIAKLADIQIVRSEELKYFAQRQQTGIEEIKAERGLFYDRNNVLLAFNRNDISFYLDLRMVPGKDKEKIADKFSEIFGKTKMHYLSLMQNSGKTICIEKKAPSEKALLLKNFKVTGLFHRQDPTRVYQYDDLASHVLGYINTEYKGANGIEKYFEDQLKGEAGVRIIEKSAVGEMITVAEEETKASIPGKSFVLTIDKSYQTILEEELQKGLEKYGGTSAIGIMMNPTNGEILALANMRDFDPNNYWKSNDDVRRNKAITDTYEPGSTFKALTMAAMLDQDLYKENDLVYVENGKYKFKNVRINDTHKHDYLTVKGVMEQSSNIGMAKLVQKLDDELYYKYLRGFGFGNYTTVNLPAEAKGKLKNPNEWSGISKAFISFGYEVSVTPLQLITAYSALINGGILYKPKLVKKEISNHGSLVEEIPPKEIRRVISEETSERMKKILASVVEKGTGQSAKSELISIGGKTGTSRKLIDGKYSRSHYNTSFVGFFPADNPKVVCLVLINSPTEGFYGSIVAAPIFKNIAEKVYNIDRDNFDPKIDNQKNEENKLNILYADNEENNSSTVRKVSYKNEEFNFEEMPDLTEYSLMDAIQTLNKLGLKYNIKGSGKIVEQSIQPGAKIKKGLNCTIICDEISVSGAVIY